MQGIEDFLRDLRQRITFVPEDKPTVACEICGDARWVRVTDDPRDPRYGGVPCECLLELRRKKRHEKLLAASGTSKVRRFRLEKYRTDTRGQKGAYNAVMQYLKTLPDYWLLLQGPPNAGKTHLAAGAANRRLEQGEPAVFVFATTLHGGIKGSFKSGETEDLIQSYCDAPFLVLDDLGAEGTGVFNIQNTYRILNDRYSELLPTIITTNMEIDDFDYRVRARLSIAQTVKVETK